MNKLRRIVSVTRQHGIVKMAAWLSDYATDINYERRFAIETAERASKEALGISDPDANEYEATGYAHFFRAMRGIPICGAFVDYGSGSGRIVLCAATFPFERVIGVEFSHELTLLAQKNVERTRAKLLCPKIELVEANAAEWSVPDDLTVFFFGNPFMGETLRTVMRNIVTSLERSPREAWIVVACPYHIRPLLSDGSVIPLAWRRGEKEIMWAPFKDGEVPPNSHRNLIYHIDSR